MKKIICIFLILSISLITALPCFAAGFTPPFDIAGASAYMVNIDTGLVLYEKDANTQRSIASLTKLMTALLMLEKIPPEEMESTIITADSYLFKGVILGNALADIRPFEQVRAIDLLYSMLLPSANEGAEVVGNYLGGGNMENFYSMMNARAKQLGCQNSNFTNTHGLLGIDDGNYSSARDVFLILQECYKHELFKEVIATTQYERPSTNKHVAPIMLRSTNKMMQKTAKAVYRDYIKGGKTGSIEHAGYNYASIASKDGYTYMTVIIGAPYVPAESGYAPSFHDAANLYDWAFKEFAIRPALDISTPINEVEIKYSRETDVLKLYPAEEMRTILPNGSDETVLQKKFDMPTFVSAPIKKGDIVGTVTLSLAGEIIGKVDLLAGQDVERNFVLFALAMLKQFLTGLYFRVVLIVSAITFTAYAIFAAYQLKKHREERRIKRPKR